MNIRKIASIAMFSILAVSQGQQKNKKEGKMPVFIGCEAYSTNEELRSCLNNGMNAALKNEIEFFSNIADYLHIGDSASILRFTITKEGDFANANVEGINPIFNSFVWTSIVLLQNRLDQNNLKLKPGLDSNNRPKDVNLTIPVRYQTEYDTKTYTEFPANERVLFTINFEDEIIEVRMNREHLIRTIGINNEREFYLGKYNNLFELATVEPYASQINDAFKASYILVTKGTIEGKEYSIRLKNFFSTNPEDFVLIEVIREENNTWAEYYSYKTKEEFNQSKFAKLTYR
ncbi:hypothetical protein [Faecalibacter sp. LW9]|uniref:hypothetical protein n=1 Tax=Faecalibacter sp. LW9 TaxID=3103144 RepID=UPI002AFE1538|nr:hypothetical protein [Faecalibacter sp. LW9]